MEEVWTEPEQGGMQCGCWPSGMCAYDGMLDAAEGFNIELREHA